LGNGWVVKSEGAGKFTVITETQKEAVYIAKEIAMHNGPELIIHGKDGKIREVSSYRPATTTLKK